MAKVVIFLLVFFPLLMITTASIPSPLPENLTLHHLPPPPPPSPPLRHHKHRHFHFHHHVLRRFPPSSFDQIAPKGTPSAGTQRHSISALHRPRCYGCCRDWEYDIYRCIAFFFGSFLLWIAQRYMPQIEPNRTPPPTPPHQNPSQPSMTCSCPPFPPRPRCYGCCRDWDYDIYRCIAFFFGSFLLWIAQRYMPERWRTPLQKFAKSLFSLEALNFVKAFMDSVWAWREDGEPEMVEDGEPEEIIADEGTTWTGSDLVIPTSVRHRQARSGRFFTAEEAIPHPCPFLYNYEMRIAGLVSRISCFARRRPSSPSTPHPTIPRIFRLTRLSAA